MENSIPETWILWYHSINDNQWNKGSYKKIHTISSLYDYQYVYEICKQDHYQNGMFFLYERKISFQIGKILIIAMVVVYLLKLHLRKF